MLGFFMFFHIFIGFMLYLGLWCCWVEEVSSFHYGDETDKEEARRTKLFARLLLLSPIWPIILIIFGALWVWKGIVWAWKKAQVDEFIKG
jgi:hypothetical protein